MVQNIDCNDPKNKNNLDCLAGNVVADSGVIILVITLITIVIWIIGGVLDGNAWIQSPPKLKALVLITCIIVLLLVPVLLFLLQKHANWPVHVKNLS